MANFNYNKVILGGRLTAEPELSTTPSGVPVASFVIAINRRGERGMQTADFIRCTAWRQTAEFITRYFRRGSSICVTGYLKTRSWVDAKSGATRWATEVEVDEACFVDAKDEMPQGQCVVDPTSEVMAGPGSGQTNGGPTEAGPQGKLTPGVYTTQNARKEIREQMNEDDGEKLPF